MEAFTIRAIDDALFAEARPTRPMQADEALAEGIRGALMIAIEDIGSGVAASTIEVIVENVHGQHVRRAAVSVSVAQLAIGPPPQNTIPPEANDR